MKNLGNWRSTSINMSGAILSTLIQKWAQRAGDAGKNLLYSLYCNLMARIFLLSTGALGICPFLPGKMRRKKCFVVVPQIWSKNTLLKIWEIRYSYLFFSKSFVFHTPNERSRICTQQKSSRFGRWRFRENCTYMKIYTTFFKTVPARNLVIWLREFWFHCLVYQLIYHVSFLSLFVFSFSLDTSKIRLVGPPNHSYMYICVSLVWFCWCEIVLVSCDDRYNSQ